MMSLAVDRRCELAPHASRSVAMALALSLNLALLLIALRPSTPFTIHAPAPQAVIATLIKPPRPAPPPPPMPHVRVVPQVVPPVAVVVTHPLTIVPPVQTTLTPVQAVQLETTIGPSAPTHAADADATIAYATATPPPYPVNAIRGGIQGTVLLKVLVDTSGKPVDVKIQRSSGSRDLDSAARTHVLASWRFHPAVHNGHAVEAWVLVPVKFDLNSL
ncbi:MAG TPA: energy transducer TonB [Rhodanobacteraceae bacterium]|nr:energy transducer TonB [Rhodanobacteraceae bacterium]